MCKPTPGTSRGAAGNPGGRSWEICVVTGARAEYGLLKPLISRIAAERGMDLLLLVTGSHLSHDFGYTCGEIENDGFAIDAKIEMLLSSDSAAAMAKSTGLGMISYADYFTSKRPDILILLGDRFETFAAAASAAMIGIPIAHINGGDTSEGAVDEFLRHSITKMSALHFPSNEASARRVIQLGENPERVYNVGALHVERIKNLRLLSRDELGAELGMDLYIPYALVTYHPTTFAGFDTGGLYNLLRALDEFPDLQFIITKANADSGGRAINAALDGWVPKRVTRNVFQSLGSLKYLSAMRNAAAVIGNSSSGLYEAPVFGIPAINVGDRQKGRLCPDNVINCAAEYDDIVLSIKKATSDEFIQFAKKSRNPYGDGSASLQILTRIKQFLNAGHPNNAKSFYEFKPYA